MTTAPVSLLRRLLPGITANRLALAFLLLSFIPAAQLAWNSRDMPHLGEMSDDGIYMVCAKSLAQGTGYKIVSLPNEPFQTKYPPVYAWLLSLVWKINPNFPSNLPLAATFAWMCLPLSTAVAWWLYKNMGLSLAHRSVLCAVLALSPYMAFLSIILFSDLLFCCFLYAALIFAERAGNPESKMATVFAAGFAAGLAYLTKSAGIAMLISAPCCFLIRKQYRRALAFTIAMLPAVVLWSLWSRQRMSAATDPVTLYYTNYLAWHFHDLHWADVPLMISSNTVTMVDAVYALFIYTESFPVWLNLLSCILAGACISGIVRLVRRFHARQYAAFGCVYALMLVVWHYPPTVRFIIPLFPLLLAGLSSELAHVKAMLAATMQRPGKVDKSVAILMSAALCVVPVLALERAHTWVYYHFPQWVKARRERLIEGQPAFRWIAANVPSSANFLADRDSLFYLYTGHHASWQPRSGMLFYRGDFEQLAAPPIGQTAKFAREQGLSYYYIEDQESLRQKLAASNEFLQLYHSPLVSVYCFRE